MKGKGLRGCIHSASCILVRVHSGKILAHRIIYQSSTCTCLFVDENVWKEAVLYSTLYSSKHIVHEGSSEEGSDNYG